MRTGKVPFQFDLSAILRRAKRAYGNRVGDVTLNLPFISIAVSPRDKEKQVARELVIRLRDRRVLSAYECCDNCIDDALRSLQEIRQILVDKQVDLTDAEDGILFLLIDAMRDGIRQFLTYEERLRLVENLPDGHPDFRRPPDVREAYFDGLEVLRGHLSRCLGQLTSVAGMDVPTDGLIVNYQGDWQLDAYKRPKD